MMMDHSVCSNCIIYRLKSDRPTVAYCLHFQLIATLSLVKFNTVEFVDDHQEINSLLNKLLGFIHK